MPSISTTGSPGSSAAAAYQDYLLRLQAQKQLDTTSAAKSSGPAAPAPTGDVDHDGDSH